MKKTILILVITLSITINATPLDKQTIRKDLIKKVENLSKWCESNNEQIAQAILLTLQAALITEQDTLLIQYTTKFSEQQIEMLQSIKKEIYKKKI